MSLKQKTDNLIDRMVENRGTLLRYFAVAVVCALLRWAAEAFFRAAEQPRNAAQLLAWCLWTPLMYLGCKFIVFRRREPHIYALLKQILIFIMVSGAVYFIREVLIGLVAAVTLNGAIALTVGGALAEIVCLFAVFTVFSQKKKR